ncbi:MAG: methyltransferase [Verrucomicrobia bacterium]|nr:methyltransferase [Verrucomicrobiota bacterium]
MPSDSNPARIDSFRQSPPNHIPPSTTHHDPILTTLPATDPGPILHLRDRQYAAELIATALLHLDLFSWLHKQPDANTAEIAAHFDLAARPLDVLLTLCRANGFILLSNLLHDWDLPEARQLVEKAAAALPANGLLVIHGAFLHDDKTGPIPVAEYSALLMNITQGKCYSHAEYSRMLGSLRSPGLDHWPVLCADGSWSDQIGSPFSDQRPGALGAHAARLSDRNDHRHLRTAVAGQARQRHGLVPFRW